MTITVECPECGDDFDFEDFQPESEINEVECPNCEAPLVSGEYDPAAGTLTMVLDPNATEEEEVEELAGEEEEEEEDEEEEDDDA